MELTTGLRGYIVPEHKGGQAWTSGLPPPSRTDADDLKAKWHAIAASLAGHASDQDRADDVQETMLRLFRRLGPRANATDALCLGHCILRRVRIDRLRRRAPSLLGDASDGLAAVVSPFDAAETSPENWVHPALLQILGARAMGLLELIVAGVRDNKAIARILDTSPCAVRRRRRRIQRLLGALVRKVTDGDQEIPSLRLGEHVCNEPGPSSAPGRLES